MSTFEKLLRLDEIKKELGDTDGCLNFVQNNGLSELLAFLPSLEERESKDREVIESALEMLLKVSINCFYANVAKQNQSVVIENFKKVNGYSILILLFKTYITERYKEVIAVILGRFFDSQILPVEFHAIIPELRNTIIKYTSKEIPKSNYYIDLALVALTSISNQQENKKHLIFHDVTSTVLPLLGHNNSNIAVHSLTLLSSFCAVGTLEVKNKIIDYGIFQHFLPPLHYFSQGFVLNPGATGSAIPVATMVNNICALIGMVISENTYGIDTFLRCGIIPILVHALTVPPQTVSPSDFAWIQTNIFNVFVACAAESFDRAELLLTFDILPLVVDVVRKNATPDTEEVAAFAAINVCYSVALQGFREAEQGRGKMPTVKPPPSVDDDPDADTSSAPPSDDTLPFAPGFTPSAPHLNPLKEDPFDKLDATPALHEVFQYLYKIPTNELSPGQTEALRQAALAVACILRGTKPNPATYHDLTACLNQMKALPPPGPGEEDYAKYAKRALEGLQIMDKEEAAAAKAAQQREWELQEQMAKQKEEERIALEKEAEEKKKKEAMEAAQKERELQQEAEAREAAEAEAREAELAAQEQKEDQQPEGENQPQPEGEGDVQLPIDEGINIPTE